MSHFKRGFAAAGLCLLAGAASADTISVNFESFSLGNLPGGADARTPGNGNQWYVPDNSATSGVVTAGVGRTGQGLVVGNRGNGNDGVIHNVTSGQLFNAAGESSSGAAMRQFDSSFWFRTASTSLVSDFAFKTESWGTDRTTWLGFFAGTGGGIEVMASGIKADGNWLDNTLSTELAWGTWYRVVTNIVFNEGVAADDVVTYSIYDETSALIGSLVNHTWEEGQRQILEPGGPYNGGQQVAVNAIAFQSRFSPTDSDGAVYIDDVTWGSSNGEVPEPAGVALVLTAGLAALAASRRRKKV